VSNRIAAAYLALWRMSGSVRAVGAAVESGIWLGLLGPRTLVAVDEAYYRRANSYRSEDHNVGGLFDWEVKAIDAHFGGCRNLLVLAAGGGREVLALQQRGFSVVAYECNPALVEYARGFLQRRGAGATVGHLPRGELPPSGAQHDGIVVGWSAYMLMPGRERRIRFLRGLAGCVVKGGPVLLSFWTRRPDARRPRVVASAATAIRRLLGREAVELGDDLSPNFVHRFTRDEIAAEVAEAGLELEAFEEQVPGPNGSGWAVARRPVA
jgi:hypothetical protein